MNGDELKTVLPDIVRQPLHECRTCEHVVYHAKNDVKQSALLKVQDESIRRKQPDAEYREPKMRRLKSK